MKPVASVIDIANVSDVVRRRCEDFGVTVKWCPYSNTAYTNGKTITLPAIKMPVTKEQLDVMYGYVIHECGHHSRPEAFKILNAAKPPKHLCALYNITEDNGMEREVAGKYRGDKRALSTTNTLLNRQFIAHIRNEELTNENQDHAVLAASLLNQRARMDWDDDASMSMRQVMPHVPSDTLTLYNELVDEGWHTRIQQTKTPHDTWDVAVDLAKRLYPNNDQDEYEEIRQAGHAMAGSQRDDAESSMPDSQGQGEGTDSSEQAESEGTTPSDEGSVVSWKDVVLSEHDEWSEGPGGTVGIDWSGKDDEECIAYMPINEVNVIDYDSKDTNCRGWHGYLPTEESSRTFANRMRRYIQAEQRVQVDRERYNGRIDKSSLVRVALPPINGGDYNKRIFYDMKKRTMKNTAIMVMVDWSGSMMGRKKHYAADAAQRLVWCFDRVLNVPVALAAFSDGRSTCDVGYIKKFNRRSISPEEIARRFKKFDWYTSANDDADAIHWAWHQLMQRKEERKMLIVLSDGCPTSGYSGGWGDAELKHLVKMIEKKGDVDIYGIGICSNAVSNYYSNYKIIQSPEEINQALFECIREGDRA